MRTVPRHRVRTVKEAGLCLDRPPTRHPDLQLFGAMFLLGLIDMCSSSEGFRPYALKLFAKVTIGDHWPYLVKLRPPAAHFLIGYGFVFCAPGPGVGQAYRRIRPDEEHR